MTTFMMLMIRMLKKPSHKEYPVADIEDDIKGWEDTEEEEVLSGHLHFVLGKRVFYGLGDYRDFRSKQKETVQNVIC